MKSNRKKYFAEGLGSTILLLIGCGTAIFSYNIFGVLGVALAFGLAYFLCYYTVSKVSGCHLNPVFSFAAMLTKRISVRDFWFYLLAQFIGSIIATFILLIIILFCGSAAEILSDFHATNGFGSYAVARISVIGAILVEIIITSIFVMTFLTCEYRKQKSHFSGLYIALVYVALNLFGFYLTGACMNPIRAFCPALLLVMFSNFIPILEFLVFLIATFVGSTVGVLLFRAFFKTDCGDLRISWLNLGK